MMHGNLYGLVITILTVTVSVLLASQTLNKNGFEIQIRYTPFEPLKTAKGETASQGPIAKR